MFLLPWYGWVLIPVVGTLILFLWAFLGTGLGLWLQKRFDTSENLGMVIVGALIVAAFCGYLIRSR
jgi:hypothetical protein